MKSFIKLLVWLKKLATKTLLHVGLHKTASTSFQETCKHNQELLNDRGFNYPELFSPKGGVRTANHSIALFNIFSKSRLDYRVNAGKDIISIEKDLSIYKHSLLSELLKKGNLILSGEDVSDLSVDEQRIMAIYLSSFSNVLKIFAVVRSPYSLHCSAFAGMINNGRDLKSTDFLSQQAKIKKLLASFARIGNIDGITMIPFSSSIKSPQGPAKFLLEAMGVSNLDNLVVKKANEGLSNEQTRNQMELNFKNPRLVSRVINQEWQRAPKIKGPKFLLSKEELDLIMPKLLEENRWFKANLGPEFCDTSFPTCD